MSRQTFIWTALPNGRNPVTGRYRISAHIAPRLEADTESATLAEFPTMADWPATRPALSIVIDGEVSVTVTKPAAVTSPAANSTNWRSLFPSTTDVHSRPPSTFDAHEQRPVVSYFADRVLDFTRRTYVGVETDPETQFDLPTNNLLKDRFLAPILTTGTPKIEDRRTAASRAITNMLDTQRAVSRASVSAPITDFLLMEGYWKRDDLRALVDRADPVATPRLDFHQLLTAIGPHPTLLRILGFVVDLEFDLPQLPPSGLGTVRVVPLWRKYASQPVPQFNVSPATAFVIGPDRFAVRAAPESDIVDGHLRLGDPGRFYVTQVDVDAAGHRVQALSDSVATQDSDEPAALPSLSSGGLAVHRSDRASRFQARTQRVRQVFNSFYDATLTTPRTTPPGTLEADDVVRGYRVDVWDADASRWFPLTRRSGSYRFLGPGGTTVEVNGDEEAVTSPPTTAAPPPDRSGIARDPKLYLPERLFRWTGWSLSVPRPGKPIQPDDSLTPATDTPDLPGLAQRLQIDLPVAQDLPRLRFGRRYAMRARATDIAGNGPSFEHGASTDDGTSRTTAVVPYLRFDPVPSPTLVARDRRTPGETIDLLVIRSENASDTSPARTERHVVAPSTSQELAELHGRFDVEADGESSLDGSAARYASIAARDGKPLAAADENENTIIHVAGGVHDSEDPAGVVRVPGDSVAVTYLPDVLARGAAFQLGVDHGSSPIHLDKLAFGNDSSWPNYRSVRLALVKGPDGAPVESAKISESLLEVALGPAQVRRLLVSSYVDDEDVEMLGMWHWLIDGLETAQIEGFRSRITAGQVPTVSARMDVRLVHAVRTPSAPTISALSARREPDQTVADLTGQISYGGWSTGRLDLIAEWNDPIDEGPGGPDPTVARPRHSHVLSSALDRHALGETSQDAQTHTLSVGQHRHDFGDTKFHAVEYSAVATSAFLEYFRETSTHSVAAGVGSEVLLDTADLGAVPGTVTVRKLPDGPALTEGNDFDVVTSETPDGRRSVVRFDTVPSPGMDVEVTYVRQPATRTSPQPFQVAVLSTRRPAPPKVAYAIPIFRWERQQTTNTTVSTRRGRALRVYVERPWWSSGRAERLGVVLGRGTSIHADTEPFLTRWGYDPIATTGAPTSQPTLADFPNATVSKTANLAENGSIVDVAAHDVAFDAERDLWYADIVIDRPLPYGTFIRLALARLQPGSNPGLELSPVVAADFIQLSADRTATVVKRTADLQTVVDVTVTGASFHSMKYEVTQDATIAIPSSAPQQLADDDQITQQRRGASLMVATVERRVTTVEDPLLGWEPVLGASATLTSSAQLPIATTWQGSVTLPRTSGALRIVIEEFEWHYGSTDGSTPATRIEIEDHSGHPAGGGTETSVTVRLPSQRRLVHRDIIDL